MQFCGSTVPLTGNNMHFLFQRRCSGPSRIPVGQPLDLTELILPPWWVTECSFLGVGTVLVILILFTSLIRVRFPFGTVLLQEQNIGELIYVIFVSETMTWSEPKVGGSGPGPRRAHTATLIGSNKLYIFGGGDGNKALNQVFVLDTGIVMSPIPLLSPSHTYCATFLFLSTSPLDYLDISILSQLISFAHIILHSMLIFTLHVMYTQQNAWRGLNAKLRQRRGTACLGRAAIIRPPSSTAIKYSPLVDRMARSASPIFIFLTPVRCPCTSLN